MSAIVEVRNLSKKYGSQSVLTDVSFSVRPQTIYGFLGQNGAGKTTTMRCLLGLAKVDGGDILIAGEPVVYGKNLPHGTVGYLPDVPEFYGFLTAKEYLELCGEVAGKKGKPLQERVSKLLALVGLSDEKKRIGGYSRGMKQRLGIAQALIHEPALLICDEPTSALDPVGRKEILEILKAVKEHTTIIFSTHILSDVDAICDEVGILHDGKIVLAGPLNELKARYTQQTCAARFQTDQEAVAFHALVNEQAIRTGTTVSYTTNDAEAVLRQWMQLLQEKNWTPKSLEWLEPSMEDLYMEVIK